MAKVKTRFKSGVLKVSVNSTRDVNTISDGDFIRFSDLYDTFKVVGLRFDTHCSYCGFKEYAARPVEFVDNSFPSGVKYFERGNPSHSLCWEYLPARKTKKLVG